jgi:cation:H+ antiporter
MNAMLIVGCAAMVAPMVISRSTVRKDIPCSIAASVLLILLAYDGALGIVDGLLLLLGFAAFMTYTLRVAKHQPTEAQEVKPQSVYKSIAEVIGGLSFLLIGSNIFVHEASDLALTLGLSEGVVGLTVVAGGTSLPELATTVVAARKGQSALAIGNVIGSNVFNILLILGLTATISPLQIEGITTIDMAVMLISVALVWLFSFTRYTVERWEGAALVGGYLVYLAWLITSL